ncbi:MAG: hypothetical protein P1P89_01880 [Desulfobacterales bacterium]|nr:hypothetical protein [Desulfobacterales bacterium]
MNNKQRQYPILQTHQRSTKTFGITLLIAFAFWGCYPKAVGSPGTDGKQLTWAAMNREQRMAHMRKEVLPRAGDVFRAWRPARFAGVDCTLCHGQGAERGDFDMPTTHLPRLSGELLLGPEFEKHPDTTRLKLNRLVPEMAEALGLKTFSIITRTGFGCYSCHLGPRGPVFGN